MPDLKAAAKFHKTKHLELCSVMKTLPSNAMASIRKHYEQRADYHLLAAQALEAWAWQQQTGALTQPGDNGWWVCISGDGLKTHDADTPLGAVLAAMEGETDGN